MIIIIIIINLVGSYLCFFSDLCNLLCLFMCVSLTGFADDVHISHSINRIITDVHTVLKSEINKNKTKRIKFSLREEFTTDAIFIDISYLVQRILEFLS